MAFPLIFNTKCKMWTTRGTATLQNCLDEILDYYTESQDANPSEVKQDTKVKQETEDMDQN